MENETSVMGQFNNKFGMDLLKIMSRKESNLLISPLSAHIVLSMAYQGASGETAANMAEILHFPDAKTTAEEYQKLIVFLKDCDSDDVILNLANKIFIKSGFELKAAFQKCMLGNYQSEATELNFEESQVAAEVMNEWVSENTAKKIRNIISSGDLDEFTRLVLVNAVYFKGKWWKPFRKTMTQKKPFYLLSGEENLVDMMHGSQDFLYKEDGNLDCKILEIPYKGRELSMVVFLPNSRGGITKLLDKIVDCKFEEALDGLQTETVNVQLPKFRIEALIPLTRKLKEMGAEVMFTDSADFSKIAEDSLQVSAVIQKTFIEVNEEGTEAAAATVEYMAENCLRETPRESKDFIADHPFLFCLLKRSDKNILFVGTMFKCSASNEKE